MMWGIMAEMPGITNALAFINVSPNPFRQHGLPTVGDFVRSGAWGPLSDGATGSCGRRADILSPEQF